MRGRAIKEIVKKHYKRIAAKGHGCSCGCASEDNGKIAKSLGYSDGEIASVPEANLGLGCGNPLAFGRIRKGATVLDLGSGAGFDCFLAAKKVGKTGRVIGVDMTKKMIIKARENAKKYGFTNVVFKLGDIENLPVRSGTIDLIISNCVVNLSPDKPAVFREAHRVLRRGGKMLLSDIVLLEEISERHRADEELIGGCVGGAVLKDSYVRMIKSAGFRVKILSEDTGISKRQYKGFPLESIKIEAVK
jgi:arsenite methyltransferase